MAGDPRRRLAHLEQQHELTLKRTSAAPPSLPELPTIPKSIVEFVTSPRFLNRPRLYPRQATLLKIFACEVEMLTDYDLGVIAEWERGFTLVEHDGGWAYEGSCGLAPGTVDRMTACREGGRQWLRELVLVMGRRGGKGHLTAIMIAYVVWRTLALGNPQAEFQIERTKQLVFMTMAADKIQAKDNVYRDVAELLDTSPCFQPFLGKKTENLIRLRTPADIADERDGTLVIEPRASTASSGRGSATLTFAFDEMAYAPADGQDRGADAVYRGAAPSMAQFPDFAATVLASSPASQIGEFFGAYVRALDVIDGAPGDPTAMTVQLPSWGPYLDWQMTQDGLAMWPGGPNFAPLTRAVITADSADVARARKYRADYYLVEFEAQWRSSVYAYLDGACVDAIFHDYQGAPLAMQRHGTEGVAFAMHCDPSVSRARFAVMVAHRDGDAETGQIVVDYVHAFDPSDYESGHIDHEAVLEAVWELIKQFRPTLTTFDQFNAELMVQTLNTRLQNFGLSGQCAARVSPATRNTNLVQAELAKTLIESGRVHAPAFKLLADELRFLERRGDKIDHPSSGEIQTSDTADCLFNLIATLMDGSAETNARLAGASLTATSLRASRPDTFNDFYHSQRRGGGWHNPARGRRGR